MAFDIICVSRVPEAPTSVPAMIRALLERTKPVAAAARPVNEFSSEITTGMSAPPIGSTAATPIRSAITSIGKNSDWSTLVTPRTASTSTAASASPLMTF
jgi:hypothetical protein